MSHQIGFWPVFSLVVGSQIGSGVLMQPASLAPYGMYALWGWLLSSVGAVSLALVFGWLCAKIPKTGGPYAYAQEAFGAQVGFLTGWTYWVVSWVSTPVLYVASVGYASAWLGHPSKQVLLALELGLLCLITLLNLRGVETAGRVEFILSLLKITPLLVMPVMACFYFNSSHIYTDPSVIGNRSISEILSAVSLLTLWGFIGVETATTTAGSVKNPSTTIPKAIFLGTLCVAILYVANSLSIMGMIPSAQLATSRAPYADAAQTLFGGSWHLWVSIIASVVCIGTANAWTLSSGQAALGLAQAGLLPSLFIKRNSKGAPIWGLLVSFLGIIPILILTANDNLVQQINQIIDFSVTSFLFVYLICVCAFFKLWFHSSRSLFYLFPGIFSALFCLWVIWETPLHILAISSLFTLSGIPVYFYLRK